jgi:hypothetical protein
MGLAGLVLMAGLVTVDVGALAGARAAAQTAADMAALAALTPSTEHPLARGPERRRQPVGTQAARAAEIAVANGAELVMCDCSAVQAVVKVRRPVRLAPGGLTVLVTARARAILGRPPP